MLSREYLCIRCNPGTTKKRLMKISGVLLLLLLSSVFAYPAELKENTGIGDSIVYIDSLLDLAKYTTSPEIEKDYANLALTFSVRINYLKGQANALKLLEDYYQTKEEYIECLKYHYKEMDLFERHNNIEDLIEAHSRISQFFLEKIKDFDLAKKYLDMMYQNSQKTADPLTHGRVFLTQAQYDLRKFDYKSAIRNLYLCIACYEKAKATLELGMVYKFLGDAFTQTTQYSNADYYYRKAVAIYEQGGKQAEVAIIYTRIAHIYQVLEDNPKNLEYNLNAMHLRQINGVQLLEASSYLNVGEAYWLLGRKDSASFFLSKSLKLAKQINSTQLLEAIYSQLSDFANTEKRYKDALAYFACCVEYRDKLNRDRSSKDFAIFEATRSIQAIEAKNELMKNENVLQELQIRNGSIRTFLYELAFIILLLLIMFVDTLARNNRKRKNELKVLNSRLQQEIVERIDAQARLTRSEELHRFLAENTVDVISLLDSNMNRKYVSPSCEKFYGFTQQELLHMQSPLKLVDPAFHVDVNKHILEMSQTKKTTGYIYKALRKDGTSFWAEASINPVLDDDTHEIRDVITVVSDISERMKHEEELAENARQKEYLLREIHNRVKNNFTILTSLMNMQRDQTSDTELNRSLTDLQLRVRTMSLVHEQLYKNQEISAIPFDNYLQNLALIISSSFNNNRIELKTDIQPCQLAIEMALPMGLIINELITNVYKYAFPGERTGTLWVKLLPENDGKFSISICDNGIGLPEDFTMKTTHSMGTRIVQILIQQVEAQLEIVNTGGACFRILFSPNQQ